MITKYTHPRHLPHLRVHLVQIVKLGLHLHHLIQTLPIIELTQCEIVQRIMLAQTVRLDGKMDGSCLLFGRVILGYAVV